MGELMMTSKTMFLFCLAVVILGAFGGLYQMEVNSQEAQPLSSSKWGSAQKLQPSPPAMARQAQQEDRSVIVQSAIEMLFTAKNYATLRSIPHTWRKTLPPAVQREIVAQLLAYVESKRSLPLDLPGNVEIWQVRPADPACVEPVKIRENILTEGGRAEWAIRELLLVSPYNELEGPKIRQSPVPPTLQLAQQIILRMAMPESARLETLPAEQRIRLASSAEADPRLLRELAKALEWKVRLAVANNARTASTTLKKLARDENPEVRNAAVENLRRARRVFLPIGE